MTCCNTFIWSYKPLQINMCIISDILCIAKPNMGIIHISDILCNTLKPIATQCNTLKHIAKPNMRPLVVAETGSCCSCSWLPTPSLLHISTHTVIIIFITMCNRVFCDEDQNEDFELTRRPFPCHHLCVQDSVFPLYNVIMMRLKHFYVTIFVFKICNCICIWGRSPV